MSKLYKLTKEGYLVPKTKDNHKEIIKLKAQLTVKPEQKIDYGGEAESFNVYRENKDNLIVPRYFGIKNLGIPKNLIKTADSKVSFEFMGKPRGTQPEVINAILEKLKVQGGGILQLHTGYGKTVVALYLASILKLKTLIIVHKTFLQDQWYDRIKQFTNANIGIIRQKKTDVENKDIVIGMLQSISMIDYDPGIFKDFNLVICDECFPGYTLVNTDHGPIKISNLYKLWKSGEYDLPLIESFNESTKMYEYKKMTFAWEKETTELLSVELENGQIINCTPNHKFLTVDGYIEAKYLTSLNTLICNKNKLCNIISIKSIETNDTNNQVYDIEVEDNHNFIVFGENTLFESGPIVHNCHHFASRVFSKALQKMGPKYTIGLSATPIRQDGLTKVLNWFIGDILVKVERTGDNAVYVKSFDYESDDKLFIEKKRWVKGKTVPDTVKMITNLGKIKARNTFITNIINSLRKKDERKILVLSGRIDHLQILKKMLDDIIAEDVKNNVCDIDEFKTGFYIGKMKGYELEEASQADILFGTYSMAEEGLDIDGLNTLVLATPKKDIIQSIGRIMRKPIEEGDVNPLVIEINDLLSCMTMWGTKRESYYAKKKYNVSKYKAFNDKVITFKDYMIQKGIIKKTNKMVSLDDLRKEYIIHEAGEANYEFEKDIEFDSYPDEMFNYSTDYDELFEINHVFDNNQEEKKVIIDLDPKIVIKI